MRPKVVICGSYHQDPPGLSRLFRELEMTGCRILSPLSIDFIDSTIPIVRADHEDEFDIDALERWHLRALKSADFVMLHAPGGYIGVSGAFEIGYANASNKQVFSLHALADEMLLTRVITVNSVFEALRVMKLAM